MHELSLCENILQILEAESVKQGFDTVKTVWLEIGDLSCIEVQAMLFSFDAVTRNSLAEGAKLVIIKVPGTAWCTRCSKNMPVEQRIDACPDCGNFPLQLSSGDQMKIKELEVS